jgi:hypothetical protein
MEVSFMPEITRLTRRVPARTSGVNLREVRRPTGGIVGITAPVPAKGDVKTEEPAPEPKKNTKAPSSSRKPETNDSRVKTSRG